MTPSLRAFDELAVGVVLSEPHVPLRDPVAGTDRPLFEVKGKDHPLCGCATGSTVFDVHDAPAQRARA